MTDPSTSRRDVLRLGFGATAAAWCWPRTASAAGWLPYDPAEVRVLRPRTSDSFARAVAEFLPAPTPADSTDPRAIRPIGPAPARALDGAAKRSKSPGKPPTAYTLTAIRTGVPAWTLYGVALQESQLAFGRETLPYPWTLCVRGRGERHAGYEPTLARLKQLVRGGVTNVDCGAMQVNWHWHQDKLRSFALALDPYPNLAVGAGILRGHFSATGDWFSAVGLYHTGSVASAETRARARRYATSVFARLRRMGVTADFALAPAAGGRDV